MGDSGEGLIDAEARIQERIEELQRERERKPARAVRDPALQAQIESLALARKELERQLNATTHAGRRSQIGQAIAEVDRRIADTADRMNR